MVIIFASSMKLHCCEFFFFFNGDKNIAYPSIINFIGSRKTEQLGLTCGNLSARAAVLATRFTPSLHNSLYRNC